MLTFVFPSIQLNDKLAKKEPLLAFELKDNYIKVLSFAFAWQPQYFFISSFFFLIFCLAEKMKGLQLLFQDVPDHTVIAALQVSSGDVNEAAKTLLLESGKKIG